MERFDVHLDLADKGGIDAALTFAVEIGGTSRAIQDQPEPVIDAVKESIHRALAPWAKGEAVELPAAIWLVSAVNP